MDTPFGPRSESCFYVSGDVQVHPSAAIASNVLLQADSGSRLVVGPGVSVGSGAVLHAQGGVLSLAAQVTLGTGVLIIGRGRIGANACVGSKATILVDVAIAPGQMVAANAILGHGLLFGSAQHNGVSATPGQAANPEGEAVYPSGNQSEGSQLEGEPASRPENDEPKGNSEAATAPGTTQIYGKVVVERLLRMMSSASPPDLS